MCIRDSGHTERVRGFTEHMAAHEPGIRIVGLVENNDDDIESYTVTKDLLEAHPEIDAIYITAAGVYGAGRAIQSLGRTPPIRVVCFDTVPTTVRLIKEGVIAATIDQQPFVQGSKPLGLLYEYLTMGDVYKRQTQMLAKIILPSAVWALERKLIAWGMIPRLVSI